MFQCKFLTENLWKTGSFSFQKGHWPKSPEMLAGFPQPSKMENFPTIVNGQKPLTFRKTLKL